MLAILIGLPTWYVIGILVAFSNDFGKAFGFTEEVLPKKSTMFAYVAIAIADVTVGFVSQWLKSRKKALFIFYILTMISYFFILPNKTEQLRNVCYLCSIGIWYRFLGHFVTMAAEQFGTNLRGQQLLRCPIWLGEHYPLC